MLFHFGPAEELLTPIAIDGSVKKSNPFFSPNDISPAADVNLNSSSIPSNRDEMDLPTFGKDRQMNDKQLDDEFLSSLEFTDFGEFDPSSHSMVEFQSEDYFHSSPLDTPMSSFAEKSIVLPALDSESSLALPWVGEECTIESGADDDAQVSLDSPMPSVSSIASSSASSVMKQPRAGPRLSVVERRLRKKDQNKTAAEKYRLKKRTERDELAHQQTTLQNQNRELKAELENSRFRLEQFKQLFVDILQIPIPPSASK